MQTIKSGVLAFALAMLLFSGCNPFSGEEYGTKGNKCFTTGLCESGLDCVEGVCVDPNDDTDGDDPTCTTHETCCPDGTPENEGSGCLLDGADGTCNEKGECILDGHECEVNDVCCPGGTPDGAADGQACMTAEENSGHCNAFGDCIPDACDIHEVCCPGGQPENADEPCQFDGHGGQCNASGQCVPDGAECAIHEVCCPDGVPENFGNDCDIAGNLGQCNQNGVCEIQQAECDYHEACCPDGRPMNIDDPCDANGQAGTCNPRGQCIPDSAECDYHQVCCPEGSPDNMGSTCFNNVLETEGRCDDRGVCFVEMMGECEYQADHECCARNEAVIRDGELCKPDDEQSGYCDGGQCMDCECMAGNDGQNSCCLNCQWKDDLSPDALCGYDELIDCGYTENFPSEPDDRNCMTVSCAINPMKCNDMGRCLASDEDRVCEPCEGTDADVRSKNCYLDIGGDYVMGICMGWEDCQILDTCKDGNHQPGEQCVLLLQGEEQQGVCVDTDGELRCEPTGECSTIECCADNEPLTNGEACEIEGQEGYCGTDGFCHKWGACTVQMDWRCCIDETPAEAGHGCSLGLNNEGYCNEEGMCKPWGECIQPNWECCQDGVKKAIGSECFIGQGEVGYCNENHECVSLGDCQTWTCCDGGVPAEDGAECLFDTGFEGQFEEGYCLNQRCEPWGACDEAQAEYQCCEGGEVVAGGTACVTGEGFEGFCNLYHDCTDWGSCNPMKDWRCCNGGIQTERGGYCDFADGVGGYCNATLDCVDWGNCDDVGANWQCCEAGQPVSGGQCAFETGVPDSGICDETYQCVEYNCTDEKCCSNGLQLTQGENCEFTNGDAQSGYCDSDGVCKELGVCVDWRCCTSGSPMNQNESCQGHFGYDNTGWCNDEGYCITNCSDPFCCDMGEFAPEGSECVDPSFPAYTGVCSQSGYCVFVCEAEDTFQGRTCDPIAGQCDDSGNCCTCIPGHECCTDACLTDVASVNTQCNTGEEQCWSDGRCSYADPCRAGRWCEQICVNYQCDANGLCVTGQGEDDFILSSCNVNETQCPAKRTVGEVCSKDGQAGMCVGTTCDTAIYECDPACEAGQVCIGGNCTRVWLEIFNGYTAYPGERSSYTSADGDDNPSCVFDEVRNVVHCVGGAPNEALRDYWIFDITGWTWGRGPDYPGETYKHSLEMLSGNMIAIGGNHLGNGGVGQVKWFSFMNNEWTPYPTDMNQFPLPWNASGVATLVDTTNTFGASEAIIACGGFGSQSDYSSECAVATPYETDKTWNRTLISAMPFDLYNHTLFQSNDEMAYPQIHFFGGWKGAAGTSNLKVFKYMSTMGDWVEMVDVSDDPSFISWGPGFPVAASIDDNSVLIFGKDSGDENIRAFFYDSKMGDFAAIDIVNHLDYPESNLSLNKINRLSTVKVESFKMLSMVGIQKNGDPKNTWLAEIKICPFHDGCGGSPYYCDNMNCDDGEECTRDVCDEETETCDYIPVTNGTPCDDGMKSCTDGICQ